MLCFRIFALLFVILNLKTKQSSAVLKVQGNLHISDAMAEFLKMKVIMDGMQNFKESKPKEHFAKQDSKQEESTNHKKSHKTKNKATRHYRHEAGHTKTYNNVDV